MIAPGTFALSERDLKVLAYVHPKLEKVVLRAAKLTEFPFMVFEGVRTLARQKQLKARGASKTLKSRHLTGHAVDLVPLIDGKPVWDAPATRVIAAAMFTAAHDLGLQGDIRWGGDWDGDGDWRDERFYDGPHFELVSSKYPASSPAQRTKDYLAARKGGVYNQTKTAPSNYDGTHKTSFASSVQRALNDLGIKVEVDGYYGDATRAAVRKAQKRLALPVLDGWWGPATSAAYHAAMRAMREADAVAQSTVVPASRLADVDTDADNQHSGDVYARVRQARDERELGVTGTADEHAGAGFTVVELLLLAAIAVGILAGAAKLAGIL